MIVTKKTNTKGDENMNNGKYTAAELNDAEKLAKILASIPEEKRTLLVMMANSFLAGMEARESMNEGKA